MKLIGRDEILEPDTVGDWFRRMGDPKVGELGLKGWDRVRDKINARMLKRDGIKGYTLDADATEVMGEKADALFTYNGNVVCPNSFERYSISGGFGFMT